ncbi:hypothetical protein ABZX51_000001 [Aspergillus tubingensis]
MIYYAYAEFASAPQISQAYVISSIINSILQLPIAKILNIWGHTEGFLVFLAVYMIGMIVLASCNNPNGFAAGYTLWNIGYSSLNFILSVFVADASGLRNRAFVSAFISTPTLCTVFTGSIITQAFITHSTWRWSYGCFTIITFMIFVPVAVIFKFYQQKAERLGLLTHISANRTITQSIIHYIQEFNIIGGALLMAAFIFILLPFSLQTYGYTGYSSATFIAMIIIDLLLFPIFALWEAYFAHTNFIRWELFRKHTVLGAYVLSAIIFFSYTTWDQYFYYYTQVVYNLNTSQTGYMTQIYSVGSTIWTVLFKVWIRRTKYFKHMYLFFGAPLLLLSSTLMIHFRSAQSSIGYLIISQIFIAVSSGTLVIRIKIAAIAAADRDGMPLMIAMISLSRSIGAAMKYTVASAIYTNTFPNALLRALPDSTKTDYATIYSGGSTVQLLYPPGSPEKDAINYAWAYSQKYKCITATCLVVLTFPAITMWKNYNVNRKQIKNTVI